MSRGEAIKFVIVRSIGNFLLLISLYGVVMTFGPVVEAETKYLVAQTRGVRYTVDSSCQFSVFGCQQADNQLSVGQVSEPTNREQTDQTPRTENRKPITEGPSFADVLAGAKEQVLVPKDTRFSIVIPKIGATAKVFPNVDPGNPDEFKPILKQGVAHAKGTVFPGMTGNTYLFAHSASNWWDIQQYNAVFYLLKNLSQGDEIIVFFEDQRYEYKVTEVFIAEADDVSLLTSSNGKEQLVLQTCWPPGTTLKRQFVVAVPKAQQ